jgi:hypothetical protein
MATVEIKLHMFTIPASDGGERTVSRFEKNVVAE